MEPKLSDIHSLHFFCYLTFDISPLDVKWNSYSLTPDLGIKELDIACIKNKEIFYIMIRRNLTDNTYCSIQHHCLHLHLSLTGRYPNMVSSKMRLERTCQLIV